MTATADIRTRFSQRLATPTIWLTIGGVSIYAFSCYLAINGHLGIGWAIALNAIATYVLFTPMHEAGHGNISGKQHDKRWINEVVGWIAGLPLFAPYYLFKVLHFRHHAHTNHPEKDPDHWVAAQHFAKLLLTASTIFPLYMVEGLRVLWQEKQAARIVKRELRIGYYVLLVMIVVVIVLVNQFGWYWPVMLWLFPALLAQITLAITFDWLPHHPHEHQERYLNTRVFDIPALSVLMLSQNYHLMHHLYPNIPFYHYRDAYQEMEEEIKAKGTTIIKG